jgi:hypothetical protein
MEEGKSKFKIVDRRRFDYEGNPVPDSESSENLMQENQATSQQITEASKGSATESENQQQSQKVDQQASDADLTFSGLILSLMSQALMHMGEVSGVPSVAIDLEAAKNVIDILDILKQKTSGNLTKEEAELLNQACGSLKLKYLEVVNRYQHKTEKI